MCCVGRLAFRSQARRARVRVGLCWAVGCVDCRVSGGEVIGSLLGHKEGVVKLLLALSPTIVHFAAITTSLKGKARRGGGLWNATSSSYSLQVRDLSGIPKICHI